MSSTLTWRDIALSGRLLVEASAGTGKTWTMAALYVRLLLDDTQGTPATPEGIVVSTYTDAAAQELSQRLRLRVEEILQLSQAETPLHGDDPVRLWVMERWEAAPEQRGIDKRRLLAALAHMDRAPIGTLHSLCHRILSEFPLESGLGFQSLDLGDGRRVFEHLARDLLRQIGAGKLPDDARTLPSNCGRLSKLVKAVSFVLQPGAIVESPPTHEQLRAMVDAKLEAKLRALTTLKGNFKNAQAKAHTRALALCAFIDDSPMLPKDLDGLLNGAGVNGWVLPPAQEILEDPAFKNAMGTLSEAIDRAKNPERAFWSYWWPQLRAAQNARIDELGELSFDLLIERVRESMLAAGSLLPEAVFARWPVALVDEFQDTDGAQYALLNRWFRDEQGNSRGLLAMVGDPKQAIYSFRGGDIHAYLEAREHADASLSLDVNQRSSTAYVEACNAFFHGRNAALSSASATIVYQPVKAAGRSDATPLTFDGESISAPLVLHQQADLAPNSVMRPMAIAACAEWVVQLLQPGRYRIGERALEPGDIAVLLVANADVAALRRALLERGVPCVGQARQTVFDSEWSRDLLLVLYAARHPNEAGALRAALLTKLLGVPLSALKSLQEEGALDAWRDVFSAWHQVWQQQGVLAAVLATVDYALPRLGKDDDGERALTDLRHLGELLQEQASAGLSPDALLGWMHEQHDDEDAIASTERSLRLESDAKRVRLMTLHASKGLEFPVVLLPTLWSHEQRNAEPALGKSDVDGQRAAVFEKRALEALELEQQDERFRLLYVALTRAVHACHVFTLPPERPASRGKNAKLKTDPDRSALDCMLERWSEHSNHSPFIERRAGWPTISAARYTPPKNEEEAGEILAPLPKRFALPGRYSFSTLSGGVERASVEPSTADDERGLMIDGAEASLSEIDEALAQASNAAMQGVEEQLSALAIVRGTGFGQAMHDLLENRDTQRPFSEQLPSVQRALEAHAVRVSDKSGLPRVAEVVAHMLDRCLHVALPTGSSMPCTLATLPAHLQRAELSFCFTVSGASLTALRAVATAHGEPHLIPERSVHALNGTMKGAIDLVFEHDGRLHVLDYKTNALDSAQAYRPEALTAAMDSHHYRFQAFLYTVAVHRYLRQRIGDSYSAAQHIGPAIYIFLRAAGLAPDLGLWSHTFPPALVEAADRVFAGHSE